MFTVTHIFIQISVYDQVTMRLVEKATQLKETDLFTGSVRNVLNGPVDVEHYGSIQVELLYTIRSLLTSHVFIENSPLI